MGFFGKMFGKHEEYPALDPETPAARHLDEVREPLETLTKQVSQSLEVIPTDHGAYVFIGKPPKEFGMAWIEEEEVKSFKTLMEEKSIAASELGPVSEELRDAYRHHEDDPRYSATLAGREVVVIPSPGLGREVKEIIEKVSRQ